jgi:hypothetical protein
VSSVPLTTVVTPPRTPPPDPDCPELEVGGGVGLCGDDGFCVELGADEDDEELVLGEGTATFPAELEPEEAGADRSVVVDGPASGRALALAPVKPGTPGRAAPLVEALPSGAGAPGTAETGLVGRLESVGTELD